MSAELVRVNQQATSIEELMAELNANDDKIAAAIEHVEVMLHARISVHLEMPVSEDRTLVFGKLDKRWCFQLRHTNGETRALRSCTRIERMEFFSEGWIDKFLATVTAQLADQLAQRVAALKEADRILLAMAAP